MKRCPTCNRSYADDTVSFCLQDGTHLEPDYDPEATVVRPAPPVMERPEYTNYSRIYQAVILLAAVRIRDLLSIYHNLAGCFKRLQYLSDLFFRELLLEVGMQCALQGTNSGRSSLG